MRTCPVDMTIADVAPGIEWTVLPGLSPYLETLAAMEARAAAIREGRAVEAVWLVEHPPLYTAGTSAAARDLVDGGRFPVFRAGRGGKYTYHGPGQRVGYVMLDLERRGRDIRCFVHALEAWVARALAPIGIAARGDPDNVGIWVDRAEGAAKIGAIGVRVRRWVTFHGFAVNLAPDLGHFTGIVPCGLPDVPVTSARALGADASFASFDDALFREFQGFIADLRGDAATA